MNDSRAMNINSVLVSAHFPVTVSAVKSLFEVELAHAVANRQNKFPEFIKMSCAIRAGKLD